MTHPSDVNKILTDAIVEHFGLDASQITGHTPLFTSALLSSIQLIQMIMLVEEKFAVTIPGFDVGMETFDTVDALSNYIVQKLAG